MPEERNIHVNGRLEKPSPLSRRTFIAASSCALGSAIVPNLLTSQEVEAHDDSPSVTAARAVLTRLLGARAHEFELKSAPHENQHEIYTVSADRGRVSVHGSSAVALCRGAYMYLREACSAMVTWSGQHLDLPGRLPDLKLAKVVCPYKYVQYYNPCTFGYSTAFWNWERWERELDWMALHGITMALAMEGQEAIWQRVWTQQGISNAELQRYFTGPAQLPWHRMGNINNFDGPLPQEWIDLRSALQKKILGRMRELGITPIVPGFSGFVPQGFKRVHPEVATFTEFWESTKPRQSKTFIVDPGEANIYKEIGKSFIQTYRAEYGPAKYYLVDTFNEMSVPARTGHKFEDVSRFARSVYDGITAGDPDGVWVMQAWICRNDPKFWDDETLRAFLSEIPNDRMIILDYSSDYLKAIEKDAWKNPTDPNVWKTHNAFHGKQWFNGMVHTEGGNNNVKGNLAFIAAQPAAVLKSSGKGNLAGWSISMEGIHNNEVVYELMTDVGWSAKEIDPEKWILDYSRARYGAVPPAMKEAWALLMQSAYGWHDWLTRHA
jgi:alpha-N-acetylglucosaminidase